MYVVCNKPCPLVYVHATPPRPLRLGTSLASKVAVQGSQDRWVFPVAVCRCICTLGSTLDDWLPLVLRAVRHELHAGEHDLLCRHVPSGLLERHLHLVKAVVSIVRSVSRFLVL